MRLRVTHHLRLRTPSSCESWVSGVGSSAETQRRRGGKTQRGLGQDAVDWIGQPRAIAEKPSASFLTDEPWTSSRWSERGWAVAASVNGNATGGSSPSLCRYP